jgi:hypothetical protein
VRGVADDGLVEVADFDFDFAVGAGDGAEVADVAVAADPDGRALRKGVVVGSLEPLVELQCVAADVGVGAASHFADSCLFEDVGAVGEGDAL